MKAKIIAGAGVVVLTLGLFFALKPKSFHKQLDETLNHLTSYVLEGDMEMHKGEDVRSYALQVAYQKEAEKEYFKVSLLDKQLNQEQMILRNDEGVFVVTPALNQVFKFEGDWPLNSPKPYLMQSMNTFIQQEDTEIEKKDQVYVITSNVSYPSNKEYQKQVMVFDEDAKIQQLQVFDQQQNVQLQIQFKQCKYNEALDVGMFQAPTTLEKPTSSSSVMEEDLPLYPAAIFNSQLSKKTSLPSNGTTKHMLEFKGEKNFTVIEQIRKSAEETQTVLMPGEMIDGLDVVGFYDGTHMSAIYNGVEYSVYSNDLGPEEMMQVITSMQVAVMK